MLADSFLLFYSISRRIEEVPKEKEEEFFRWFRDEFTTHRPGYFYNTFNDENVSEKYRLVLLNLRAHGKVVEAPEKAGEKTEDGDMASLPEDLLPSVFFSVEKPSQRNGERGIVNLLEISDGKARNRLFDDLSARTGLRIPKKDLLDRLALLGRSAKTISRYYRKKRKLTVEFFDMYFQHEFVKSLLVDRYHDIKNLSIVFHVSDLAVARRLVAREKEAQERLKGEQMKMLCSSAFRRDLASRWSELKKYVPTGAETHWATSLNLKINLWQPLNTWGTGLDYLTRVKNAFHRRRLRIDKIFHYSSDHSFHVPSDKSGEFDEPIGFHVDSGETAEEWAEKRGFAAQRLLVTGGDSFS